MIKLLLFCLVFHIVFSEKVILLMKDQVDLDEFRINHEKMEIEEKPHLLVKLLMDNAEKSQKNTTKWLISQKIPFRSFFLPSFISTNLNQPLPSHISIDIKSIIPNPKIKVNLESTSSPHTGEIQNSVDWNVKWIKADLLHEKGVTGKGIIVANADTGIRWDHPALTRTYRGRMDDGKIDHNYSWYDALHEPIDEPENVCGYSLPVPCDDYV